jgi:hypothetical protein
VGWERARLADIETQLHGSGNLVTFWPPGPEARIKVIVSSESGINIGKCYFQNSLDDHADTRAHFLKILSRVFPLASSSTSLSR